jgi:hypothetical protein
LTVSGSLSAHLILLSPFCENEGADSDTRILQSKQFAIHRKGVSIKYRQCFLHQRKRFGSWREKADKMEDHAGMVGGHLLKIVTRQYEQSNESVQRRLCCNMLCHSEPVNQVDYGGSEF